MGAAESVFAFSGNTDPVCAEPKGYKIAQHERVFGAVFEQYHIISTVKIHVLIPEFPIQGTCSAGGINQFLVDFNTEKTVRSLCCGFELYYQE